MSTPRPAAAPDGTAATWATTRQHANIRAWRAVQLTAHGNRLREMAADCTRPGERAIGELYADVAAGCFRDADEHRRAARRLWREGDQQ